MKGYNAEEIAKENKKSIESDYTFIKQKMAELRNKEEEIETIRKTINRLKTEYRIESVQRVLEFIRLAMPKDECELDKLLSHCQNKLSGNIDGVELELTLSEEVE